MRVFYGAGHEQFTPSELLGHARPALAVMNCSGADPERAIRIYGEHVLPRVVA